MGGTNHPGQASRPRVRLLARENSDASVKGGSENQSGQASSGNRSQSQLNDSFSRRRKLSHLLHLDSIHLNNKMPERFRERRWRRRVNLDELEQIVDDGDLLLFSGRAVPARVIREPWGIPFVVEATGVKGVDIWPLAVFVSDREWWNTNFHHVSLRRLLVERTPAMRRELHAFIDEIVGKPFTWNPLVHVGMMTHANQALFKAGITADDHRAFFCSKLVAGAYKSIGLLPQQRSITDYQPQHFGSSHGTRHLKLQQGAILGREIRLVFKANVCDSHTDEVDTGLARIYAIMLLRRGLVRMIARRRKLRQLQPATLQNQEVSASPDNTNTQPKESFSIDKI